MRDAERPGRRYHAERGNDRRFDLRSAFDLLLVFLRKQPRHRQSRLGCRLNGGLAQWAERHGCRESRPPPWMADGGGPTERDWSEGTRRSRAKPRARHFCLLLVLFKSKSPKAKQSAPRQTLLTLPEPKSVPELPAQPRRHAAGIGLLPRTAWRGRPSPAVIPAVIGTLAVESAWHIIQHMHA